MLDRRAIESLQRWVNDTHGEGCNETQFSASAEIRRFVPDLSGHRPQNALLRAEQQAG